MKTIRLIGIGSLALSMFACSSSPSTGGGFPGSDQSSGGGSNGGGASSSGNTSGSSSGGNAGSSGGNASSSGSSSSGGNASSGSSSGAASSGSSSGGLATGDAAPTNNPEIDYSVAPITLTMTQFTVAPGGEVFYCQNFANPWGKQVDIKTYSLDMGVGSHHMFAFYASGATNGTLGMCPSGGLTFGAFTFSAQSPTATVTYPATVGATLSRQGRMASS